MHTTGQAFMMAFQAGGPHAQDRGLEAVAYAWDQMRRMPAQAHWEKPQGKNEPLRMEKRFRIVPRGIGLVIGCCTFPTWNGYPGLFASLATGNAVDRQAASGRDPAARDHRAHRARSARAKPASIRTSSRWSRTTPATTRAQTARAAPGDQDRSTSPAARRTAAGSRSNARQAQVYTEKAGVNQVIIDSAADFKGLVRNLAFSLALYTGQMCTAPQNIYVPQDGIDTAEGHLSFDEVAAALAEGVDKLLADPARAVEMLGAVQNDGVLRRARGRALAGRDRARHADDRASAVPGRDDPHAADRASSTRRDRATYLNEWFGPIAFVIATDGTADSLAIAARRGRRARRADDVRLFDAATT